MADWGAQSLQAVWFTSQQSTDAAQLFEKIVGAKPDHVQQQTVGSALAFGGDGKRQYRLQIQATRIDYFENPTPAESEAFPLFSSLDQVIEEFTDRAKKGGELAGKVTRLAFVTQVFKPVASSEDATAQILTDLKIKLPVENATDLLLQINKPIKFKSKADVDMNRLLKFQKQTLQLIELNAASAPTVRTNDFISIEVDVNSSALSTAVLSAPEQTAMWDDLKIESTRLCVERNLEALG